MSKITKIVEIIFFFLIIPTILIPINSNIIMFATLSLVAFFCFIYLRYKKISGYENLAKIEQRIMYFIKHYEYDESKLIEELQKKARIRTPRA